MDLALCAGEHYWDTPVILWDDQDVKSVDIKKGETFVPPLKFGVVFTI